MAEKDLSKIVKVKTTIVKSLFAFLVLLIVTLLFFLFKNIIFEIIRLTKEGNNDAIKDFMASKGWLGYIAVVVIEALQIVVVFISAEFIQIPAGLTFNFFVAILLCDMGVCLGASIIYLLINIIKMDNYIGFIEKGQKKIEKKLGNVSVKRKEQRTQILMYFLFVTPLVPFGAICYYGSSKKISYWRYIFTCATGVVPSIITSILMGASIKYYISSNLKLWTLLLIIIALGGLLIVGMYFISRKFLFGSKKIRNTPNSLYSYLANFIFSFYVNKNSKVKVIEDEMYDKLGSMPGAKLYLCNHLSANDIYHCYKLIDPDKPAIVVNKYYTRNKMTRLFINRLGFIPKSLFNPDVLAVRKMMKYKNENTSILMFPEARLSLDGTTNPITYGTGQLTKKLEMPLVLLEVSGNYFANSKIRTAKKRCPATIRVKRIIEPDELNNLSVEEIDSIIKDNLSHDDSDFALNYRYKDNNKAHNLSKLLYYCPKCHSEFKMHDNENSIYCDCGFKLDLNEHYRFSDNEYNISTIHDYYNLVKNHEKENLNLINSDTLISQEVIVKKISFEGKKKDVIGEGITSITKEGFNFTGKLGNEELSFSLSLDNLQALPFSINEEYECYYNDELYYFYPKEDKATCTKVTIIYDLLVEEKEAKETMIK